MSLIVGVYDEPILTSLQKDSGFFNRIKRHRVDPTASSLANPPPDYYGEKIGSVAGYRRWLKDQRAFNLKTGRYRGAGKSA
jgi:import inner membrane translocase subunit TIM23